MSRAKGIQETDFKLPASFCLLLTRAFFIIGNSRKMFGNVRLAFGTILENLRKSSESGRKSSENRQKRRHQ